MKPLSLRRHHVLVAHEHNRAAAVFPLPVKQQVSLDLGLLQILMNQREELFQHFVKAEEFLPVMNAVVGDRLAADHGGKLLGEELLARLCFR